MMTEQLPHLVVKLPQHPQLDHMTMMGLRLLSLQPLPRHPKVRAQSHAPTPQAGMVGSVAARHTALVGQTLGSAQTQTRPHNNLQHLRAQSVDALRLAVQLHRQVVQQLPHQTLMGQEHPHLDRTTTMAEQPLPLVEK